MTKIKKFSMFAIFILCLSFLMTGCMEPQEESWKQKIPPAEELYVPDDFPDFTDDSAKKKLWEYGWTPIGALRVVEIREDAVYFADSPQTNAQFVLLGTPQENIAVGDHVKVILSKSYTLESQLYYVMGYKEDLIEFTVLNVDDLECVYNPDSTVDKPVIYFYPEEETVCSAKVILDGELTCTYPEHGDAGWQNFTAMPDGTLLFEDGSTYYCLYWEGVAKLQPDFTTGFCVKGSDTAEFLKNILPQIGLSDREANEFIIYWLPILQKNPYNLIAFQQEAYTEVATLEIMPEPDSLLRVYMAAKPLTYPLEIEPQTFDGFVRRGFTVVEWGGSIIQ